MSETEIELRAYQPGDEAAIVDLFQTSFGVVMPLEQWRWRFAENPAGGPFIELAWAGDRLAAHYAVSGSRLCFLGDERQAALSVTTMTHPDFRGRGLFGVLAARLYQRLADLGHAGVYGFPNANSHDIFVQSLGWSDILQIPQLSLDIGTLRKVPAAIPGVVRFDVVDERFDALWQQSKDPAVVQTVRDAAYVAWRYLRHPFNKYQVYGLQLDGALAGWFVIKPYGTTGMDLIDFLAPEESSKKLLLAAAVHIGRQSGVDQMNTWVALSDPAYVMATAMGFRPGNPITYLGGSPYQTSAAAMLDPRNWRICMGDSDVY